MGLLDLVFPTYCVQCRKIGDYLCSNCFAQLSFDFDSICLVCNGSSIDGLTHPSCRSRYVIDGVFCGVTYKRSMKKLLYAFKYKPYLSDLGDFLTDLLYEALIQQELFMHLLHAYSPVFIPIPLYPSKLRKRGYNQAQILAYKLAKKYSLHTFDCMSRVKDTQPQFGLKREERIANMKGVFAMKKNVKGNGLSAFLIDDVLTTGTTLLEAANILKHNGFENVWGICLTRDQ